MSYSESKVITVKEIIGPDENLIEYRVAVEPEVIDTDNLYGSQLLMDVFRPTSSSLPTPVNGEVWIDGSTGDPKEPTAAMLIGRQFGRYGIKNARLIEYSEED
ncbi:hypothetical protein EON76_03555 [bacterium]|nr:MAG: hypothetical protein EON76_03555 [bacterium]